MDLFKAFEFPFTDPSWFKKVVIGTGVVVLCFLLPFVGFPILYGWGIHIARDIKYGEKSSLPEWSRIWSFFLDGVKFSAANLVWGLPSFLLSAMGILVFLFTPEGMNSDLYNAFRFLIPSISMLPLFLWSFISPVQFGVAADTGSFIATINPIHVFKFVKKAPGQILLAWLIAVALQIVLSQVGTLSCCIGYFPAIAFEILFWGAVFGRVLNNMQLGAQSTGD